MKTLEQRFEQHNNEYLKFDKVEAKRSNRPDLHAFLLLDSLFPADVVMVSAAEHGEIFLNVDLDLFSDFIRDETIIELVRCGVRLNNAHDCLAMFV